MIKISTTNSFDKDFKKLDPEIKKKFKELIRETKVLGEFPPRAKFGPLRKFKEITIRYFRVDGDCRVVSIIRDGIHYFLLITNHDRLGAAAKTARKLAKSIK